MNEDDRAALRDARTQRVPPTEELRALTRQLFARALRRDGWIVRRENFEGAQILECCNNALAGSRRIRGTSWFMASSMLISASNSRTCASYLTARLDLLGRHVEAGDRRWH